MKKYNEFVKSKYYIYLLASIVFVTWIISYIPFTNDIALKYSEIMGFSLLVGFFVFNALFSNTALAFLPIFIFLPFIYARGWNVDEIPSYLYIDTIIAIISLVVFALKNKVKFKFNKMTLSLLIFMIAVVLGGLLNEKTKLIPQLIVFGICLALFMVFIFFNSGIKENNFDYLALTMHVLSLLLIAQIFTYYLNQADIIKALSEKSLHVGWGMNNNIAAMLLLTMPFTAYFATKKVKFKAFFYVFITALEAVAIILTYSRGSILALLLIAIPLLGGIIKKSNDKDLTLIYISISIMIFCGLFLVLFYKYEDLLTGFINSLFKRSTIHTDGRIPIYKKALEDFKNNPLFGVGLYYPLSEEGVYNFYHSTILHTMACYGSFGLIALLIHLKDKYLLILKNKNFPGFICFMAFLGSDLYGLIDVTYYTPYYMLPLLLILAVYDSSFCGGKLNEVAD